MNYAGSPNKTEWSYHQAPRHTCVLRLVYFPKFCFTNILAKEITKSTRIHFQQHLESF